VSTAAIAARLNVPAERAKTTPWRAVLDAIVIMERNLIAYTRVPEALFFSSVQPVMFVLLFRYVFGGAIKVVGIKGGYVNYLMPGIFVQTVCFGSVSTSIGLAEDLQKGIIERFRSLPMARSAVLAGRTLADLMRNVVVVIIITGVGYAVGFRVEAIAGFFAGVGLLLLFAYCLSWGFAVIGLSAPNSETAQVMAFPILFPLTFAAGTFVPVTSMPGWLQGFATYQPVGEVVAAARGLMVGGPGPTANHVVATLLWCAAVLLVLAPLAVWKYRTRTA
jgi:ABC-2 type transport system permease protein/oleandomycin transport system permease protein